MDLGKEYVSITMEIDTGDGRIVMKSTPEFLIYDNVQFEIARYLTDIYPYIIEVAYLHMVWDALDKRKTSVFELLSPYYAYIGNGYPTELYTPKSLRLNLKYRKEREILDKDESLLMKSADIPKQEISDCHKQKDKNLEKTDEESSLWLWVGSLVLIANVVATKGASLCIYVPIALVIGLIYWVASIDKERWAKLILYLTKIRNFFKKIHFPRIKSNFFYLFAIASISLVVGAIVYKRDLFDGYYMLLRVITCAVCTYSAVKFKTEWTRWIFGIFAVLYNPVLPVHLGNEDLWSIINLTTVVYMWIALRAESKSAKSTSA